MRTRAAEVTADGYEDFARSFNPVFGVIGVFGVFDEVDVEFALEVRPGEIAYDYGTTGAALDAIGDGEGFGINWDPSHMIRQQIDPTAGPPDRRGLRPAGGNARTGGSAGRAPTSSSGRAPSWSRARAAAAPVWRRRRPSWPGPRRSP